MRSLHVIKAMIAVSELAAMLFLVWTISLFVNGYPMSVVGNHAYMFIISATGFALMAYCGFQFEKMDRIENDPVEAAAYRITRLQQEREDRYQRRIVEGMTQPGGLNYNTGTGEWRYNSNYNVISREPRDYNSTSGDTRIPELANSYQAQSLLERSVNEYEREQRRITELVDRQLAEQQLLASPMIRITATQNRSGELSISPAEMEQSFSISMDLSGSTITEDKPTGQPKTEKVEEKQTPEVVVAKPVMNAISSLQINE